MGATHHSELGWGRYWNLAAHVARKVLQVPTFDTIITGAGVSMPAGLWSGDRLTAEIWASCQRILDPANAWTDWLEAAGEIGDAKNGLRLEQFLEILSSAFPSSSLNSAEPSDRDTLMHVYDVFDGAAPCSLHRLIDSLDPTEILTLNVDLLHESVNATRPVLHLHGSLADHTAIKTLVSQYRRGLDVAVRDRLRDAIAGNRVLVVGYSGRDRDVLPLIVAAGPARLTWMLYQPSAAAKAEVLDDDVLTVLARLGTTLQPRPTTLPELVSDVTGRPQSGANDVSAWEPNPSKLDEVLRGVDLSRLALGVAHVLFDLGRFEATLVFLTRAAIAECDTSVRNVLMADCLRNLGHPWLSMLRARPALRRIQGAAGWSPYFGSWALALRQTHLARIPLLIDQILTLRLTRAETAGAPPPRAAIGARIRRAQDLIDAGQVRASLRLQAAAATGSDLLVELPTLTDRRTWKIEALVLADRQAQASEELTAALQDEPYANRSQRALLHWAAAHVEVESLTPDAAIARASKASALAGQARSVRDQLWTLLTKVDITWRVNTVLSENDLDACQHLTRWDNGTALVHVELLRSDYARLAGDLEHARERLANARRATWHGILRGQWFWPSRRACAIFNCALAAHTLNGRRPTKAIMQASVIAVIYRIGGNRLYSRRSFRLAKDLLMRPEEVRTNPAPLLL